MRDLANFCGDIRDGSWKQEREAGISIENGSGILCFWGVGKRESQGEGSGYGIWIFTRLHDLTGAGWYKWIVCGWSVSAFKWCIDQGRVASMTSYYESFCVNFGKRNQAHVVLHFLVLSAFLAFPTLSIERLLEQAWSALVQSSQYGNTGGR